MLATSKANWRIVGLLRECGRDCCHTPGEDSTCGKRVGWQLGDLLNGDDQNYIKATSKAAVEYGVGMRLPLADNLMRGAANAECLFAAGLTSTAIVVKNVFWTALWAVFGHEDAPYRIVKELAN